MTSPTHSQNGDHKKDASSLLTRLKAFLGMEEASVRQDLQEVLDEAKTDDALSEQERTILNNVLKLHQVRIRDVMIPRADIIGLSLDSPLDHILATFRAAEHSRLPVYNETLDDPRGMLHIRDFVDYIASAATRSTQVTMTGSQTKSPQLAEAKMEFDHIDLSIELQSTKLIRPVLFVPGSMPALDLLVKMQSSRTHMALVIDEYGGTEGLVSLEDIVEVIVGDIADEHDDMLVSTVEKLSDGSLLADARTSLDEIGSILEYDLKDLNAEADIDTIGGLVAMIAGRVPSRGEIIKMDDVLECQILEADPRRIKKVKLRMKSSSSQI